jgi:hypothetical protein
MGRRNGQRWHIVFYIDSEAGGFRGYAEKCRWIGNPHAMNGNVAAMDEHLADMSPGIGIRPGRAAVAAAWSSC